MPRIVEIPDDLADALTDEALRLGLSLPDYAVRLLTSTHASANPIRNGEELVAFWRAEGLVGTRSDLADSRSEARRLRDQAQRPRA